MIRHLIKKYSLRSLRRKLRGRYWCRQNDGFSVLRKVRNEIIDVNVGTPSIWTTGFFGASAPCAELVARQFVIHLSSGGLTNTLFEHLGSGEPIRMGMPRAWRNHLEQNGWKVDRTASAVAWHLLVLNRFILGTARAINLCLELWRKPPTTKTASFGHYVMLEDLTPTNLPPENGGTSSYDICSFYARWQGRRPGINTICHGLSNTSERNASDLKICYRAPAWKLAAGKGNALRLLAWTIAACSITAIQMLTGRWQYALLLADAARARAVRLCSPEILAREYLFPNSGTIYRPMWTYEAQRSGSDISLYFYSTYEQPKLASGYESQCFEWGPANWPRYIVWDARQEEMLRRDLGNDISVIHAGAITFTDNGAPISALPERSVIVFDIPLVRPTAHFGVTTLADALAAHPDYYLRFLEDIAEIVADCGGVAILKGKRDLGSRVDKRYRLLCDRLVARGLIRTIDPAISAVRAIEAGIANISTPFTSTAIYGQALGRPSAYYDPAGWIQRDDLAARGITLLHGKAELRSWLDLILTNR